MKRNLAIFLLILVLGLVTACGSGSSGGGSQGGNQEKIPVIITHETAVTQMKHQFFVKFAEMIEEKSGGRFAPEVYPSSQLYSDADAVEAMGTGSVHIVAPASGRLEALNEAYGVFTIPFALQDEVMLANPEYRREINDLITSLLSDYGIKNLGLMRATGGLFIFNGRDVQTPEDLKGAKVRVPGGQLLLKVMENLGVTAISMPATEVPTAIVQGTIDGSWTSADGWVSQVGDAAKYAAIVPNLQLGTYTLIVDQKWFDGLPADLQNIIVETADELTAEQWQESIDNDEAKLREAEKYAESIVTFNDQQLAQIREMVRPAVEEMKNRFPDVFQQFADIQAKYNVEWLD